MKVPPEPREMVAYYTAQKLCLGCVGTYYSSSVRRTQGLGLLRGLPTECNGTHSAEQKGKNYLHYILLEAGDLKKGTSGA